MTDAKGELESRQFEARRVESRRLEEIAAALRLSERRLRLALDAGHMGTWEWDVVSGKIHWSAALETMHGVPVGSFAGTVDAHHRDLHPADRERVLETTAKSVAKATDHSLLYRIVRPDGAVRWLEAHARFETDELGTPRHLFGVCSDVTDRVQAEETRTAMAAEQAGRREVEQATQAADTALVVEQASRLEIERAGALTQQILAGIADAFVVCAPDWSVVFANEAGARLFGRSAGEMTGNNVWELVPEATGTPMQRELLRAMADRRSVTIESWNEQRDEWREWTAYPLPDGALAFYARDIKTRKQAEERRARATSSAALRAEAAGVLVGGRDIPIMLQQCCESVVKHLPMAFAGVWLLDPTSEWLELQASAGQYTHLGAEHRRVGIGGESRIGLIAAERKPHLTNAVLDDEFLSHKEWARQEGMVAFVGFPLVAGDVLVGVLGGFARVQLPDDTMIALGGVSDAIAHGVARRRAEIDLDERARELARSNADLEQFAYVASHDLQEPLRTVSSYTQLLARRYKGKLDKDADEFIAFAVDAVTRMQRLIRDLLAYSRVGTRDREFGAVSMEPVIATALDNLRLAIAETKAQITHDPLPTVIGDEGQFRQLWQNLIGNALKFRGPDTPTVHVSVRREGDGDGANWQFSVKDNGVGIEPQYFDRIFVIFQRLHSMDRYPGTGIGLAVCKKIVERHGGRIWVESQLGAGSTFFFSLPAAP
jgi:PAS domain S-box-containing protein